MGMNRILISLFGLLVVVSLSESRGRRPTIKMNRTCIKIPKHLHKPVLSNDCESVVDDTSLPENKLIVASETDSQKNPNNEDIVVDWLVGIPYKSPYTGKETELTFDFKLLYDDSKDNLILKEVDPTMEYSNDEDKYFAKHLTAETISSSYSTHLDKGQVTNRKHIKTHIDLPKSVKCDKPFNLKVRFYTNEVPDQKNLDYMYITYNGIITNC